MVTVTLCPPLRVMGIPGPLAEKLLLEVCTPLRLTRELRVFVTTTEAVELFPTATDPKETLAGESEMASFFAPVPETETSTVAFSALLSITTFPLVPPVMPGVKVILSVMVCAGFRVAGKFMPATAKAELVTEMLEMTTGFWPLLVKTIS